MFHGRVQFSRCVWNQTKCEYFERCQEHLHHRYVRLFCSISFSTFFLFDLKISSVWYLFTTHQVLGEYRPLTCTNIYTCISAYTRLPALSNPQVISSSPVQFKFALYFTKRLPKTTDLSRVPNVIEQCSTVNILKFKIKNFSF